MRRWRLNRRRCMFRRADRGATIPVTHVSVIAFFRSKPDPVSTNRKTEEGLPDTGIARIEGAERGTSVAINQILIIAFLALLRETVATDSRGTAGSGTRHLFFRQHGRRCAEGGCDIHAETRTVTDGIRRANNTDLTFLPLFKDSVSTNGKRERGRRICKRNNG